MANPDSIPLPAGRQGAQRLADLNLALADLRDASGYRNRLLTDAGGSELALGVASRVHLTGQDARLPAAATATHDYWVKNVHASSARNVLVQAGEDLDGTTDGTSSHASMEGHRYYTDGAAWFID